MNESQWVRQLTMAAARPPRYAATCWIANCPRGRSRSLMAAESTASRAGFTVERCWHDSGPP